MKIFSYLKPYWKETIITIITLFINVLGVLLIPRITVNIIDQGVANGDIPYILRQGGLMLLVAFLAGIFMVISVRYSTYVSTKFAADVRQKIFEKTQNISITQFEKIGAASMIVRSTDDVTQIQTLVRIGLRMMLRAPLMFIGGIIMAVSTNPKLTKVFLITLPITVVVIGIFGAKVFPIMTKVRTALDNINKIFRQRLSGIRVIRAFDRERYEEKVFSKYNDEYINFYGMTGRYASIFVPMLGLIMSLTLVGIIYYGSNLVVFGEMKPGEILGFLQYANNIMMSFLMLSMIFVQIPRAQASLKRINEVLNLEEDIVDSGEEKLEEIKTLEFKNVSFKYPGEKNYTLKDISFYADKGDLIGIIGSTGSGKTTLANLLVRFYEVEEGQILINGKDIKEYEIHSLRNAVGYTEQKASLISGTVCSNVTMHECNNARRKQVEDALEVAQADFILTRADGVLGNVAQRGGNFSGGQKQRISIARAIYKDPSLYLIDDSFSALDYKTERELRSELFQKSEDKIFLVITQRAAVASECKFIILLDEGKMIAKGNHEELKETSQEYREILESQDFEGGSKYDA